MLHAEIAKSRTDLTDYLVHWTKGENWLFAPKVTASEKLVKILNDEHLKGGSNYIKGGYRCVCFTETPLDQMVNQFQKFGDEIRYEPYGIAIRKEYFF